MLLIIVFNIESNKYRHMYILFYNFLRRNISSLPKNLFLEKTFFQMKFWKDKKCNYFNSFGYLY